MMSKYKKSICLYTLNILILLFVFNGVVACGSQFYQISVKEDFEPSAEVKAANPGMEDPESTLYGIHAPSGFENLPITIKLGEDMNEEQRIHFLAAIRVWEWAIGQNLFEYHGTHSGVSGDTFEDLFSSLDDNINGHYLDNNWGKTDKPNRVLATTIWTTTADYSQVAKSDIRFNHERFVIADSLIHSGTHSRDIVDMQSVALHELGHLLGLAHIDAEVDSHSIMNPSLFIGEGLTSRRLSKGDIERIQLIYGCQGVACDIDELFKMTDSIHNSDGFENSATLWLRSEEPSLSIQNLSDHQY